MLGVHIKMDDKKTFKDDRAHERYTAPVVIAIPFFLAYILFLNARGNWLVLVFAVLCLYIGLTRIIYFMQSITVAPLIVEIEGDIIRFEMVYGRKKELNIKEMQEVVEKPLMTLFTIDKTIYIKVGEKDTFVFSKWFCGIKELLIAVQSGNPCCKFRGKYFDDIAQRDEFNYE